MKSKSKHAEVAVSYINRALTELSYDNRLVAARSQLLSAIATINKIEDQRLKQEKRREEQDKKEKERKKKLAENVAEYARKMEELRKLNDVKPGS